MPNVDLGYLERSSSWRLESRFFPSKAGGKPAWLSLENLPCGADLTCEKCKETLAFLCQIYAPYEEDDNNFHRTLFVFICKNAKCYERNKSDTIRIFRSVLPRHNKFYSPEPPTDEPDPNYDLSKWLTLCSVCGCVENETCAKCVNDTKQCSTQVFAEQEIYIEPEIIVKQQIDEKKEVQKFLKLQTKGTLNDIDESEIDQHYTQVDKTFMRFRKRIQDYPDQVLRYSRGGEPLLISDEVKAENIPNCEYCGSVRQFEFQIMPQMLALMEIKELDWGVLLFFTCKKSCTGDDYKKEYVFKQDVSLTSL